MNCRLQRELDKLAAQYDRAAAKAIAAARAKYVVPFCDRTGYSFSSGMGSWSFHKENPPRMVYAGDADRLPRRLLAVLQTEVHTSNNDAGSLMEAYTPKKPAPP